MTKIQNTVRHHFENGLNICSYTAKTLKTNKNVKMITQSQYFPYFVITIKVIYFNNIIAFKIAVNVWLPNQQLIEIKLAL